MDIYQHDSILAKKGGSGYMNTGFDQNLLKSKSDQINQTFHNIAYDDLYRLQSKDHFNWEITKEEKNEKGYQLQKAVTNFGDGNGLHGSHKISPFLKALINSAVYLG